MADEKPKLQAKRTKRLRAPSRDEYVRYIVAIESWDWSYSLGLDDRKDSMDPYREYRHLRIGYHQSDKTRQARTSPILGAFLLESVLHFYSGQPPQHLSGIDSLIIRSDVKIVPAM